MAVVIRWLAVGQGVYFLVTGCWPLVSFRTFELVTGPKADDWLVRTVGVLIAVIGLVLLVAGARDAVTGEIVLLAAGSAGALATIDTVYARIGRIARIYLLDAALEIPLVVAWLVAAFGG